MEAARTTTRLILAITFLLIVTGLSSCGEDEDPQAAYYVRFEINGESFSFNGLTFATFSTADDLYLCGIGGFRDNGQAAENMLSVLIGSQEPVRSGVTYSGLVRPGQDAPAPTVFFSYLDGEGTTFGNRYGDHDLNKVTVTALADDYVKGTFSGKIYLVTDPEAAANELKGEFFVKRTN